MARQARTKEISRAPIPRGKRTKKKRRTPPPGWRTNSAGRVKPRRRKPA